MTDVEGGRAGGMLLCQGNCVLSHQYFYLTNIVNWQLLWKRIFEIPNQKLQVEIFNIFFCKEEKQNEEGSRLANMVKVAFFLPRFNQL